MISTNSIKAGGCNGPPVTFTITVNPAPLPAVAVTGNLTPLATVYGTPSASESFSISATSLRAAMLITAPKGFEVSLDNAAFSPVVSAGDTGTAGPVSVYIRLAAATPVGNYSGDVTITGPALNYKSPVPQSSVTPAPLMIIADNKTKVYGAPNPPLTITYKGFVNNDTPGDLFAYPIASTSAAVNSPPGNYPINVGGAGSTNYDITYVPGVLTVFSNVVIPNAFTPNGDGVNDTWDIQRIGGYPNCTVQVFNRYGSMVYSSVGYGIPWNGSYKGAPLPPGTYYYIINLNAGVPVLSGFVAIIR